MEWKAPRGHKPRLAWQILNKLNNFFFGNLQDDAHSRLVIRKNYLGKPGNYFAYYAAYPVGRILYILAPAEGKLYTFKKRG